MIAGRYTLERVIGRGGAGTVHLGRDEVLGRRVAIKRIGLMPGTDSPDLRRAEREARLAAALDHPHVVGVFDLVQDDDDSHWLVMEYVEGKTLAELTREVGSLPATRAAGLLAQAADALTQAHAAGIVHRDVKPSNIFVAEGDLAKLGDFGIARATTDATLTQTGLVTGSPSYLAPEVASGATADPRSDVWSLGATLFHAVTGRPPYEVDGNLVGTLYRIVHDEPPGLPAEHPLAGVLSVTMVQDPAARWPMARVRDELARISRGEAGTTTMRSPARSGVATGSPAPPAPGAPAAKSTARRRTLAATAGALVLGLLLVLGWQILAGAPDEPPRAEDQSTAPESPGSPQPDEHDPEQVRQEMDAFVEGYLDRVTSDPRAAFANLTPDFQAASGGYEGYIGWWGKVRSATLQQVVSDPENLTVSYRVRYVMENGRRQSQDVTLRLVRQDGTYLIDGEG